MTESATDMNSPQTSFLERDHAWALFSLALILRLAVFLFILLRFGDAGFILPPFSDGHGYVTIAENVLEGRGFSLETQEPFLPDTKRVPLYPLYLSATFVLSGGAWWLAALLQTFMGAAIALLVYKITEAFTGRRAAFFAGALAAIYPFAIFLSTQLLAETLFTFVLFGAFAFFMRTPASHAYRNVAIGGILMGLATLAKPAGQYIPFILLPFIALRQRGLQRVGYPMIFIVCFFLAVSPWVMRNHYATGIATISYEANILFDLHIAGHAAFKETGVAARADQYRTATSSEALLAVSQSEYIRRVVAVIVSDPIGFSQYLLLSTVPFIFGDGFVTMVVALSKDAAIPAWNFSTSGSALGRTIGFGILPPWLLFLSITSKGLWGIVLIGAGIGFIRLVRDGGSRMLIALAFMLVIAYFMVAGGPVQSARYRAPVEPLIFLLAGVGIAELVRLLEVYRRGRRVSDSF